MYNKHGVTRNVRGALQTSMHRLIINIIIVIIIIISLPPLSPSLSYEAILSCVRSATQNSLVFAFRLCV